MHEVQNNIFKKISEVIGGNAFVDKNTTLLGVGSVIDSMKLVELCLALEDMASEMDFSFDWTSDVAMSKSRSMFRTAETIVNEFIAQMDLKK